MSHYRTIFSSLGILFLLFFLSFKSVASDWIYTAVEGDNLWNLSEKYLDSPVRFEQIRKLNNIKHPRHMRPGTLLRMPMKWISSNPVSARVHSFKGSIVLVRANGDLEQKLSTETLIHLGDRLKTASESTVTVVFANDSQVTLYSNSEMLFNHLSAYGKTGMVDSRLHLLKGRVETRVKPAEGPGSRFEIRTISAISAVRGTEYRAATAQDKQSSFIEVLKGKVKVSGANKDRLIASGFGTQIGVGRAPIPARKLLPEPVLEAIPVPVTQMGQLLRWKKIDLANAYRIEIRLADTPDILVWEKVHSYHRVALPDLPNGDYQIRVRGIDKLGLEGKSYITELTVDTHPQPPVLLYPQENTILRDEVAELQWTDSQDADHYRLEIATDSQFKNILLSRDDINTTRYSVTQALAEGQYYWRVTSIAADGKVGHAGNSRSWTLKHIPESVETELQADPDNGLLRGSWATMGKGVSYQVQLAYDPAFSELEIDKRVTSSGISFSPLNGQVRYLRVRAIEPDGYMGPWGTVQRVDPPPDPTAWLVPILALIGVLVF